MFPKEPGAERGGGSAPRTASSLISALNEKRTKEWVSGDRSAGEVVMPATDAISSVGAVFAFCLNTALPHGLDAFPCPTVSFNLGILSAVGKVNYVRGVELRSHVSMASFILSFMF